MEKITVVLSTRPSKPAERSEVLRFVAICAPRFDNVALVGAYQGSYLPAADTYVAAVAANNDAAARVARTVADLGNAERAFDEAFRVWSTLVEAFAGLDAVRGLGPALGDRTPSVFRRAAPAEKLERMPRVWELVQEFPVLAGTPQALADLKVATSALEVAFGANETAGNQRAHAVAALQLATKEFDRQYGALVRLLKYLAPGIAAELPRFRRKSPAQTPTTDVAAPDDADVDADAADPAADPAAEPDEAQVARV